MTTTIDWYLERFEREHAEASEEFRRLTQLFQEVCWYNFEVGVCKWQAPWRYSQPNSRARLEGMHFKQHWSRGKLMESGSFPVWYDGPIRDAPPLPPQVVLSDLIEAGRYMQACKEQCSAPLDWAPGGVKYVQLAKTTLVGKRCVYDPKRKFSSV